MNAINTNDAVPEEKKAVAINSTTDAIADNLKQHFTPANLSQLTSLFGSGKAASSSNFLVDGIKSTIVNVLVQKVGLSQVVSNSIASSIVPTLMSALSNKVNDPNEKGFDIGSLVGMLSGGGNNNSNTAGNSAGDVLGTLGKLFNK